MDNWKSRYEAPSTSNWQGRPEIAENARYYQCVSCVDLTKDSFPSSGIALIGFRSDEGVKRNLGRIGAKEGPCAIRKQLANLAVQNPADIVDIGNIVCDDEDLESAQAALAELVKLLQEQKIKTLVLGGGHETAYGHGMGLVGSSSPSIVNFDAHFDLRPLLEDGKGSSGTPFLQLREHYQAQNLPFQYFCLGLQAHANTKSLYETADEYQVNYFHATEMMQNGPSILGSLKAHIAKLPTCYVSLCLDVFNVANAPGVSAPQALGISVHSIIPFLKFLAESNKVIGFDIVELSPKYDQDDRTARLAASLLHQWLTGWK